MTGDPLVSLTGVSSGYGRTMVLQDVDLELREGDFMAVVGPNGGGKTTLFKTILGLLEPSAGTVKVMGGPPSKGCRSIGYVPQYGAFDMKYPVVAEDVVRMGLRQKQGFSPFNRGNEDAVAKAMEMTGVTGFKEKRIGDLSGGQMQRTLLARALASEPKILMLDEPTASLDPKMRAGVYEILAEASDEGMTVMMITHDLKGIEHRMNRIVRVDRAVSEVGREDLHALTCGGGLL